MNVEILNPDEARCLFSNWGKAAAVCYDSKTNAPEAIAKHCMKSGHTSGSRGTYITFLVTDVARSTIDQLVRHEEGVFKNVQSFRYVNKNNFAYEIPEEIKDNKDLLQKYIDHMARTLDLYCKIQDYVCQKTGSKERANEQARYVIPMATHSSFVIGFDYEGLVHLMHKRLCIRTEDITRQVVIEMKKQILSIFPELKDELVPQCKYLMWCPEVKGCKAYPSKKELKEYLEKINNEDCEK